MSAPDFPTAFDVPLTLLDGLDFCDAETINRLIQGAWACQNALGVEPYTPEVGAHAGAWNFPGASIGESLREFGRIEHGVVSTGLPNTSGTVRILLRYPGRFTKTNVNGVQVCAWVRFRNLDGEDPFITNDDFPTSYVTFVYDGSGDLEGIEVNGITTSTTVSRTVEIEYLVMEVNW